MSRYVWGAVLALVVALALVLVWQVKGKADAEARAVAAESLAQARAREVQERTAEADRLRRAILRADISARDERLRADRLSKTIREIQERPDAKDPLHPLLRDLGLMLDATGGDADARPGAGSAAGSAEGGAAAYTAR